MRTYLVNLQKKSGKVREHRKAKTDPTIGRRSSPRERPNKNVGESLPITHVSFRA